MLLLPKTLQVVIKLSSHAPHTVYDWKGYLLKAFRNRSSGLDEHVGP